MSELTCAQRLRMLNAIYRTVANDTRQLIPPRELAAFAAAGVTFVVCLLLPLGGYWRVLVALAAAVAAFYLIRTRAALAASWRERLDAQLAAYDPLDRGAFEALQRQAASPGGLDNLHVLCWLSAEREAVCPSGAAPRSWRFAERVR